MVRAQCLEVRLSRLLWCNPHVTVAQEGLNPGMDGACDAVVRQLLEELTMGYSMKRTGEV